MSAPPLQLERLWFTDVRVQANKEFKPQNSDAELTTSSALSKAEGIPGKWNLRLDIDVKSTEGNQATYEIHLTGFGVFIMADKSLADETAIPLLNVTGASIIYSAAREYLMMLTGRGPWGAFQLPTVSFVPAHPDSTAKTEAPSSEAKASIRKRHLRKPAAPRKPGASR